MEPKVFCECRAVTVFVRVSERESLINSHLYAPQCMPGGRLVLPGLCNCGKDNSCKRLKIGKKDRAVMFDTKYTFACADAYR